MDLFKNIFILCVLLNVTEEKWAQFQKNSGYKQNSLYVINLGFFFSYI